MAKVSTNLSLDADTKAQAQELFADLGLDLSTAVNLFLKQSVREERIPFAIERVPNKETIEAIEEGERLALDKNAKRYKSTQELFEDLGVK